VATHNHAPSPTHRNDLLKQPKSDDQPLFPPEVLLKVLEAADTPVDVMAAVCRSLQQAVLVQDPRRLSLTIDPARSAELGAGLASLAWLSHTSGKHGEQQQQQLRTGPLRLILKQARRVTSSPGVCTVAARVLLHTPLRVVTHLDLVFNNKLRQSDVDLLGSRMPRLRSFKLEHNLVATSLDLSVLQHLVAAVVNNCPSLAYLSVAGCTRLKRLDCQSNNLTAVDVSGCDQLRLLHCDYNARLTEMTGLAAIVALEELSVFGCTALPSLSLPHAVQLHSLWLPCEGESLASLALPPDTRLEVLQTDQPDLLFAMILSGHIACVMELYLKRCVVDVNVVATVPGLESLELEGCQLPGQWVLASLPAMSSLVIKSCTKLACLDASAATALTSLSLEEVDSLQHVALPAGLKELSCEGLPRLSAVDLCAAPDVKAVIRCCPAVRVSLPNLTLEPAARRAVGA
jgi:hypothetical protein